MPKQTYTIQIKHSVTVTAFSDEDAIDKACEEASSGLEVDVVDCEIVECGVPDTEQDCTL